MQLGYALLPIGMIILIVYVVLVFVLKYSKPKGYIENPADEGITADEFYEQERPGRDDANVG